MIEPQTMCSVCDHLLTFPVVGLKKLSGEHFEVVEILTAGPDGGISPMTADAWVHERCLVERGRRLQLSEEEISAG